MKRMILGATILLVMSLLAVGSYYWFSPYQNCIWEHEKQGFEHDDPDVVQECESSTIW